MLFKIITDSHAIKESFRKSRGILRKKHAISPTYKVQFNLVIVEWTAFNPLPIQ